MRSGQWYCALPVALAVLAGSGAAREVVLPAGTLLQCTLSEPNFSSATAEIGDPILCHPRAVQMFGQPVFPRGTYIVGHLEAAKDPGRLAGKGYLKLQFDRIGLPSTDLPLPGKVIAVRGYRVDREGKIIGRGHPRRDAVEWMLPPLWPWKLIMLPARGPRPALKGEVTVTMRLMDDVAVPQAAVWRHFGQSDSEALNLPRSPARPAATPFNAGAVSAGQAVRFAAQSAGVEQQDAGVTLFALQDGTVHAVRAYAVNSENLDYTLANGSAGSLALSTVDWDTTTRLNSERGVRVTLRRAPVLKAAALATEQ